MVTRGLGRGHGTLRLFAPVLSGRAAGEGSLVIAFCEECRTPVTKDDVVIIPCALVRDARRVQLLCERCIEREVRV